MTNLPKRGLGALLCLLLCLSWQLPSAAAQPAAQAQGKADAPEAAAPEGDEAGSEDLDQIVAGHVRRADEAQRRGQHAAVVSELRSAYQMDPQPIFLYRAAQAYRQNGQLKEALGMYRDYVQKDPAGPERASADAAIRELQLAQGGGEKVPVWKRGWFWAVIGGVAVVGIGLGVGLGLGLRGGGGGGTIE